MSVVSHDFFALANFFGRVRHWGFACGMFYLFPCIFSVKNIGFSSLSAKGFKDILRDFYTRLLASFLVNFLYQTLLFRFLGFRLMNAVVCLFQENRISSIACVLSGRTGNRSASRSLRLRLASGPSS